MLKRYTSETTKPTSDPALFAATYWRSALRMATLRAMVVIAAIVAIGAAAGALAIYEQVKIAAGGLGLLAIVAGVFAVSLNNYTSAVARATWYQIEEQAGEDLDHDGYVGDPTRTVRVNGKQPVDIPLDLPGASVTRAPILRPFGVSAPDLVSFLFEAQINRGLQERAWIGKTIRAHVLPSGQTVTQPLFRQLLAEIAKVGWATKTANRWELSVDPEQVAGRLQEQMQPPAPASKPARKGAFSPKQS